jgi:hypothetical protein
VHEQFVFFFEFSPGGRGSPPEFIFPTGTNGATFYSRRVSEEEENTQGEQAFYTVPRREG